MNMRVNGNSFYFTRHGESEYNSQGLIGGDSCLTDNGIKVNIKHWSADIRIFSVPAIFIVTQS